MSLLTVGTVAFDSIETPYGRVEQVIGGACAYISWAASVFPRKHLSCINHWGRFSTIRIRTIEKEV